MNEIFYPLFGIVSKNKKFWFAEKRDLSYFKEGTPSNVWFDDKVDDLIARRDELIGFFHTHPSGMYQYSMTDFNTMQVWCDMLGKDLLCLIGCPEIHGWWFSKQDECFYLGHAEILANGCIVGDLTKNKINVERIKL
jgi:hypothetical protein